MSKMLSLLPPDCPGLSLQNPPAFCVPYNFFHMCAFMCFLHLGLHPKPYCTRKHLSVLQLGAINAGKGKRLSKESTILNKPERI